MGNWRRVNVVGTCEKSEVSKLRELLGVSWADERWDCLCNGGIAGLPNWGDESFDAVGNLGERGYGPQDVASHLVKLAEACPSLRAKVHCGGDNEDSSCIATVDLYDGKVTIEPAEISGIREIPTDQMHGNLLLQLIGRRGK